jgi:hypothetical protein
MQQGPANALSADEFFEFVERFLGPPMLDPDSLRRHWRASIGIGFVSFANPIRGGAAVQPLRAGLVMASSGD